MSKLRTPVAWSMRMARSPFLLPFMMNFSMVPRVTWKGSGNWARRSTKPRSTVSYTWDSCWKSLVRMTC
ncbi:hypothetical protein CH063_14117 [Colletotrichum higginsianum]|uniref:Uncharacterized protein n=1 Tax=Colletotrichum higginsianum (strain IMI 349063) TaxID=759273 RepID=H1VX86_COLHI|nr:hypothetical protein CH063_14117 [Colletotrichum higginsianum]